MSKLLCNLCHFDVDGIAFRTTCCHFYCPKCAKQTFQNSSQCAICGNSLTEKCVKEVTSTSWETIRANLQQVQVGYQELTDFVIAQLLLGSVQSRQQRNELERVCEAQAADLNNANRRLQEQDFEREDLVSLYDQKLRESSRALAEIQEAYKEKLRKCQAWEKAYNNIRSQLSEGKVVTDRLVTDEASFMQREEGGFFQSTALTVHPDSRYHQPTRGADSATARSVMHHRMPPEVTPQAAALRSDALNPSWRQQGASKFPVLRQSMLLPQQHESAVSHSLIPYEKSALPMTLRQQAHSTVPVASFPLAPAASSYAAAGSRAMERDHDTPLIHRSSGPDSFSSPTQWPALSAARHPQQQQQQQQQPADGWLRGQMRQPQQVTTSASIKPTAPKRPFFDKN